MMVKKKKLSITHFAVAVVFIAPRSEVIDRVRTICPVNLAEFFSVPNATGSTRTCKIN